MKKIVFITPLVFALNGFSQNQMQNVSNINLSNQRFEQVKNIQVFASNMMVNNSNSNKPARTNTNPQVYVQRASTANSTQRQRRRVTTPTVNISNPVQTNINYVSDKNINEDIQVQGNFVQQLDNVGNSLGNEFNLIEQIASVEIPAIRLGSGNMDLNLDINLPRINLKPVKFTSGRSVSNSKHKTHTIKKKLVKLNRNLSGKLSFKKKLKIKVDNCFKW